LLAQSAPPGAPGVTPELTIDRSRIIQIFKYTIYAALTINVYLFFTDEWAASAYRFTDGVALEDVILGFAATIDTAAWVVLLLMFELETCVLDDEQFTPRVTWSLHGLRAACYVFIVYSFYGYSTKLISLAGMTPLPEISSLCSLVDGAWAYAIDYEQFVTLTASNCLTLSDATAFMGFPDMTAVVDRAGYQHTMGMAWVDVINSAVWLLVVLLLEAYVRLQERNLLKGTALRVSSISKYVLYSILVLALIYWSVNGGFVDSWDSFLWLVAFVFIELNVFEWRQESIVGQQVSGQAAI